MLAWETDLLASSSGYADRVNTKCQPEWGRDRKLSVLFQSFLATILGKHWEQHPGGKALSPCFRECPCWLQTDPAVLYISTSSVFKTSTGTTSFEGPPSFSTFLKMLSNGEASRKELYRTTEK